MYGVLWASPNTVSVEPKIIVAETQRCSLYRKLDDIPSYFDIESETRLIL